MATYTGTSGDDTINGPAVAGPSDWMTGSRETTP
jgi:hypothetical protein